MLVRRSFVSATLLAIGALSFAHLTTACGGSVADAGGAGGGAGGDDAGDIRLDGASPSPGDDAGATSHPPADAGNTLDASAPVDAAPPPIDAALPTYPPDPGDGAPTRTTCTNTLGTGLTSLFGRLDGTIVSIVPTKTHTCNGDSTHLHLQVLANSQTYDIAVNVDALFAEKDAALIDGAWTEGWRTQDVRLDYVSMLSVHSTDFKQLTIAQLIAQLDAELASVNHVTIFGTGYGPDGAHLIHRQGAFNDGAVVLHPLGTTPHYLLFSFDTQTF